MRTTSLNTAKPVATNANPLRAATLGWALRQTFLALGILAVVIGFMAWLTHASIDPRLEQAFESRAAIPTVAR
jgi:uncharacterized membrane protein